jgi:hypothetical protein
MYQNHFILFSAIIYIIVVNSFGSENIENATERFINTNVDILLTNHLSEAFNATINHVEGRVG